jgi:endo-1,4-beta-xylanase
MREGGQEMTKLMWTRRDWMKASLVAGAVTATPRWARALDTTGFKGSVAGADSLRVHAEARGLLFGCAVNPALLDMDGMAAGTATDPYTVLVANQANIVVAENAMKWGPLRPAPTSYDFTQADRLMRFAALAGQKVRGHNLCWHQQLPSWFKTTATRDNARTMLTGHIQTVAGRYKGRIHSWDVVNEAVELKDGRADGLRNSPWLGLIGPEYIELAFTTAAAADPDAKLTYNDYGIELDTEDQSLKRGQVLMLVRRLKARNIPIRAVGIQSHLSAVGAQPGTGLQRFIRELKEMGLDVYITEMDVNTRGVDGGPEAQDDAVAQVYRDYLGMVLAEPNVPAALTWGITDKQTWLNSTHSEWAQRKDGTLQRPLPFDDDFLPTQAFVAARTAIDTARPLTQAATPKKRNDLDPALMYQPFRVQGSPDTSKMPAGSASPAKSFTTPREQ